MWVAMFTYILIILRVNDSCSIVVKEDNLYNQDTSFQIMGLSCARYVTLAQSLKLNLDTLKFR